MELWSQGSDPSRSFDLDRSCSNARSLTHCARPESGGLLPCVRWKFCAEERHELTCFIRITLAAVLKIGCK